MPYEIKSSPDFAMIDYSLADGESVVAESGAMVSMSSNVQMKTEARGGILAAAKRKLLGGESIFQNTFTATGGPGRVMLAPGAPGDVVPFELQQGQSLFIQSAAYLAATPDVNLDTKWGGAKGFFSGVGMFLLKATGPGTVFVCAYGAIFPKQCEGEYIVDTDHIVAFQAGCPMGVCLNFLGSSLQAPSPCLGDVLNTGKLRRASPRRGCRALEVMLPRNLRRTLPPHCPGFLFASFDYL
jgi:uncharacterized protein (TIGR00266 family)